MEATLFPNDYVVINKVKYGVRVPNHFRNVAVIGGFFNPPENATKLYNSLPGFKKIKKEDIVVFKAVDGSDKFLIKRIIGMPSDTLEIVNSKVLINTIELNEKEEYTHKYVLKYKNRVSIFNNYSNLEYKKLSKREKEIYKRDIKKKPNFNYLLFPAAMQNLWTRDNYGKIIIPKKGLSLVLNNENINIYKSILKKFEGVSFELNENETKHYVFKNNYYFMLGDNRHNSLDSRSFGFVPESYIQGKMIKIFSGKRE
jgi:signal peptidase I